MSFYKILVIGEAGAGKTSLTNKIVYNTFVETYKSTIGCEFGLKLVEVDGQVVRVQLWDLAGQDRLGGISKLYCREANGAIVVADVTRPESIEKAKNWKEGVDELAALPNSLPLPMVLCMSKYDLIEGLGTMNELDLAEYVTSGKFIAGYFTSAKTGKNAEEALVCLLRDVVAKTSAISQVSNRTRVSPKGPRPRGKCC